MCGIAGIWHFDDLELGIDKLKKFTDSMKHRGPDGAGYYIDDKISLGLGHRRLSILDLSDAAKQPMSFGEERYWITYNGEIYNFLEIKVELLALGYNFKSASDTEVILAAYHKWGFEAFNKFNGMWAIALFDTNEKKLLLCRDRFGVKPLYYILKGDQFAFASETYAFKFLDGFNVSFNESNLTHTLIDPVETEGTGRTIFNDINQVLPGHFLTINYLQKEVKQKRWFNLSQKYDTQINFKEATEQFKYLFTESVKLRLRSDVPVASALSGGLDSSAVYCALQDISKKGNTLERTANNFLKAFVATFTGTAQDEKKYAEEVIRYTKGDVAYIETDFNTIISNIESSCVLFNDISATPISVLGDVYKGMKAAGITVSMDGHGADEMLYGYRSLVSMACWQALKDGDEEYFEDLKRTYLGMFADENKLTEQGKFEAKTQQLKQIYGIGTTTGNLKSVLKSIFNRGNLNSPEFYKGKSNISDPWFSNATLGSMKNLSNEMVDLSFYSEAEKELAIDFNYRNIPYNMRDFDRAAMQHGVEIRMPFMDYKLVDFCFSLPMKYKVGNGYTKLILREAMKGIMPESIRTRRSKIGMGAPLNDWFNGQLNGYILDQVSSNDFLRSSYWNGPLVKQEVEFKCRERSWKLQDAQKFWHVLNAYIISKGNG